MKPIIKWTGGKRWLVPTLQKIWLHYSDMRLVEPFVGGMAITLGLNPNAALLNDFNPHLINFYAQIKKGLNLRISLKNELKFYYDMREEFNHLIQTKKHSTQKAATIFYFLIRTGYNGLCRFNSEGVFNVPFGQHQRIRYKKNFLDYQPILQPWEFTHTDFEKIKLTHNDFVYADPPYDTEFTRYHPDNFLWQDQERLANWLSRHKGPLIVSNQATDRILKLYSDLKFNVYTLPAPRMISCTGDRKPALEMLALKGISKKNYKSLLLNPLINQVR